MDAKDHARNNFPFCRPIARHLWPLLNRGILNVEQLRFRFHSIVATKSTIHLDPKFGNLFRARSLGGQSIMPVEASIRPASLGFKAKDEWLRAPWV
jgi:hypothetical protein